MEYLLVFSLNHLFYRSKITAELAKVINDGLFYYEQDLVEQEVQVNEFNFIFQWILSRSELAHRKLQLKLLHC